MTDRAQLEADRDAILARLKKLISAARVIADEIEEGHEADPEFWTKFDMTRNVLDLKTAASLLAGVEDKVMQVGRWEEINKSGETWASVKARIITKK